MNCKNCEISLTGNRNYCSNCGAKVIHKRLTFKKIWKETSERILNVDNTFFKTFVHLFSKPEVVIESYVNGIRKRYLNPLSHLAIALTLSGVLLFIMRKYFMDNLDFNVFNSSNINTEATTNIVGTILDFQSFVFVAMIPILAVCGYLLFNKHKYFLSEHFASNIYTQANYTIATFPLSIIILLTVPRLYTTIGLVQLFGMLVYNIYMLSRLSKSKLITTLAISPIYILLFLIFYFGFFIIIVMTLMFTTDTIPFPITNS